MSKARTRSRRTVIVTIAAFVVVQVAFAVHLWLDPLLFRGHEWNRGAARQSPDPNALRVTQLGSSRTIHGFCGLEVEPLLSKRLGQTVILGNQGMTAAGPVTTLLNLQRLINDGRTPDLLLVEVLTPLLSETCYEQEMHVDHFPASRLRWTEACWLAKQRQAQRPDLVSEWIFARTNVLWTRRLEMMEEVAPRLLQPQIRHRTHWSEVDEAGYLPVRQLPPAAIERTTQGARAEYWPNLQSFRLSARSLAAVEDTVTLAQRQGMTVALVLMPEGPLFRSYYPPAVWQQIRTNIDTVAHRQGVPVLDLRECLDEGDFFDSHHLLDHGARKYTRLLAQRIEPLLRRIQEDRSPQRIASSSPSASSD